MCNPIFYEFRVALFVNIPQTPMARWVAFIGVLLSFTGGGGWGAMICFVMQACKGALHRLRKKRAAELQATVNVSCWYTVLGVF